MLCAGYHGREAGQTAFDSPIRMAYTMSVKMRAQNQQELIYKRGQAGITKASVTIVFDNSDRASSPVGLENCKQITVTRQVGLVSTVLPER
jgi:chromosome segregation ATPase